MRKSTHDAFLNANSFTLFMIVFHYRKKTERVMQTVRMANSTRFPKVIKGGSRPTKTTSDKSSQLAKAPETTPFDFSFATKPRNEEGKSPPSMDDLRKAVKRLSVKDTNPKGKFLLFLQ